MFKKNKGIIALFPAIIISSILIIFCVGASQSFLALLYRTTIFDEKVRSDMAVHACALRVLVRHNQNNSYVEGEIFFIENNPCVIESSLTTSTIVSVRIGEAKSVENVCY